MGDTTTAERLDQVVEVVDDFYVRHDTSPGVGIFHAMGMEADLEEAVRRGLIIATPIGPGVAYDLPAVVELPAPQNLGGDISIRFSSSRRETFTGDHMATAYLLLLDNDRPGSAISVLADSHGMGPLYAARLVMAARICHEHGIEP